jgi:hypothetical protein
MTSELSPLQISANKAIADALANGSISFPPHTIISGVKCNKCGTTLPPHTADVHLNAKHSIHKCPHDGFCVEECDEFPINNYEFVITNEFKDIETKMSREQTSRLNQPSGLGEVLLRTDYFGGKCRRLDFTGTTNEEAIKKILTFYKHKTFRRMVGDHIFFEGFTKKADGDVVICLGS